MSVRKIAAARGAAWITEGLAIFKDNPKPYLSVCLLMGLLSSLPFVSLGIGLFNAVFYAGLISALHRQAQGGTPQIAQIFDGFTRPGAFARVIMIALLNIAMAVFALIVLAIAIGPALIEMIRQGNTQPDETMVLALLPRMGVALLVLLPLGIFVSWVSMLAVPRAMLDEVPGTQAIREAMSVIFANLGALLVNLLCLFAIMLVLVALLMIPMFLLGLFSLKYPLLSGVLQVPVMTVFGGAVFALYSSIMYQAWRDIYAGEIVKTSAPGSLEA